jgi:hypothetical protein
MKFAALDGKILVEITQDSRSTSFTSFTVYVMRATCGTMVSTISIVSKECADSRALV